MVFVAFGHLSFILCLSLFFWLISLSMIVWFHHFHNQYIAVCLIMHGFFIKAYVLGNLGVFPNFYYMNIAAMNLGVQIFSLSRFFWLFVVDAKKRNGLLYGNSIINFFEKYTYCFPKKMKQVDISTSTFLSKLFLFLWTVCQSYW